MPDIRSPVGRLAFPSIFRPREQMQKDREPLYETALVIPKDFQKTNAYKALQKAVLECAKEEFGDKVNLKAIRLPFRKGETVNFAGVEDDDIVIRAKSKYKPGVVDQQDIDILDESEIYPGAWATLMISPYAYDTQGNKGVTFSLGNVKKLKDGPRTDGRKSAAEAFGEAAMDSEEQSLLDAIEEVSVPDEQLPDSDDPLDDDVDALLDGAAAA